MVTMKKNALVLALGLGGTLITPVVSAVPLTGLLGVDAGFGSFATASATVPAYGGGSYFSMGDGALTPGTQMSDLQKLLTPGSDGGVLLGTYQNFVLNPDVPHPQGWQGDTNGDGIPDGGAGGGYGKTPVTQSNMLLPFSFFGISTYVGTNPIGYQSGDAHPAPTADVDMSSCVASVCNMTLEISAWEVEWNGNAFEQGPRPLNTGPFMLATGTYNLDTHFYSITWDSEIKGGGFNGFIGTWHLEGTHVVPVPAAVWLLGSGLLGLAGIARRKRAG